MLLHHILRFPRVLQPMSCWYSKNTCSPPSALALGSALGGLCGSAGTPQRVRGMKKGMLCWLARGTTSHTGNQILCNQRQLRSKLFRLTAASLWEDKRVSQESLSSLSHSLCDLGLVSWGVKRSDEHLRLYFPEQTDLVAKINSCWQTAILYLKCSILIFLMWKNKWRYILANESRSQIRVETNVCPELLGNPKPVPKTVVFSSEVVPKWQLFLQVGNLKARLASQEAELQLRNHDAEALITKIGLQTEKVSQEKAIADAEERKVRLFPPFRVLSYI